MFGFCLKSPSSVAVLHFPGSRHVMDVTMFTNELRLFVLSALHCSQVQSTFFYHNAFFFFFFPPVYNQFIFSNYSREGPGQRGILQQVSQKIVFVCSLASFNVILWSGSLKTDNASSPGVQYVPSFHCHQSFPVCIQSHQYFLSTLSHKRFRPTQSLLELMVPPLLMTTAVNQSSVTCCWQTHLKSGSFFFFFFHS